MNTRLQVEHPVTELVTGLDLVAQQIAVAEGARLEAFDTAPRGHAVEVRLYAEDPSQGWSPQSGLLTSVEVPGVTVEFARAPRRASGSTPASGRSVVGIHYDAMLAKVISWAPTRAQAARELAAALARRRRIHGVCTNRDLLVNVLRHEAFLAGDTDTAFFDRHGLDVLAIPLAAESAEWLSALAATLAADASERAGAPVLGGIPSGWRNVVSQPQRLDLDGPRGPHTIHYRHTRTGLRAQGFDGVGLVSSTPTEVVLDERGMRLAFTVARYGRGRPTSTHRWELCGSRCLTDSPTPPTMLHPARCSRPCPAQSSGLRPPSATS